MLGLNGRAIVVAALALIGMNAFANEPEAVPGEYVVKLKTSVAADKASLQTLSNVLGAYVKSTIADDNIVVIKRASFEKTTSAVSILSENPLVEIVEPNYIYRIKRTPNDPLFPRLWGMSNSGHPGIDIGAEKAWDITTGSKDVLVAVIDTGINYNHPDLKDNVWVNEAELNGVTGVDDDGNGVIDDIHGFNAIDGSGDPLDDHGHGSHCSGTIGGHGDDGVGIAGVNWNVRIMGVKFLSGQGSGTLDDAIKGIDYAVKMGAKILSNSWGGGGESQTLKEAIERANAAGVLFVAAAGNESNNNDANATFPATYDVPNMIAVAAIDANGALASFSNYGKTKVHVAAPGVGILSSINTNDYDSWDGTSMATPHVTGIAALLLAKDPTMTSADLKTRIVTTAKRLPSLRGKVVSGGVVNAYTALVNEIPPVDMDDPANWSKETASVSTPHPYVDKYKATYSVSVPGAKQISIHFSKFNTERGYDFAVIKDKNGKQVDKMSGANDDTYTMIIDGDSATIDFSSDDSVSYYGFDIDAIAYR